MYDQADINGVPHLARPTDDPKGTRLELRVSDDFLRQIDEWRRQQDHLPARATALRELVALGLERDAVMKVVEVMGRMLMGTDVSKGLPREKLIELIEALLTQKVRGEALMKLARDVAEED